MPRSRAHKKYQTNVEFIRFCNEQGILMYYSAYIALKNEYANGVIYNFSNEKLASILKVSVSTAKRYFKQFLKYGFIKIQHTNKGTRTLRTNSIKSVIKFNLKAGKFFLRPCSIKIKPKYSLKDISDILINKLIQKVAQDDNFKKEQAVKGATKTLKQDRKNPHNRRTTENLELESGLINNNAYIARQNEFQELEEIRLAKGGEKSEKGYVSPEAGRRLIKDKGIEFLTGQRSLSEKLGLSLTKTWKVLKNLEKLRLIQRWQIKVPVRRFSNSDYSLFKTHLKNDYVGHVYHVANDGFNDRRQGMVISHLGTIINFTDYPIEYSYK